VKRGAPIGPRARANADINETPSVKEHKAVLTESGKANRLPAMQNRTGPTNCHRAWAAWPTLAPGVLLDCVGLGSVNNDLARFRIIPFGSDWEQSLARETVGNGGQCATAILANVAVPAMRNQQVADSRGW
jgi:hypothetical protein